MMYCQLYKEEQLLRLSFRMWSSLKAKGENVFLMITIKKEGKI